MTHGGVNMSGFKKSEFPYESFDAARQDKFAKLGGADRAFNLLVTGWQQRGYRKQYNMRKDAILERAKQMGIDKEIDGQASAQTRKSA
jgi:hypothetical protein